MLNGPISRRSKKLIFMLTLALAAGGFLGGWAMNANSHSVGPTPAVTFTVAPERAAEPVSMNAGFAPVVKQALPAVVNISTSKIIKVSDDDDQNPFLNDPQLRQFFGPRSGRQFNQPQQQQREHALGSGVIVNKDGYILTNNHVIDGATQITVDLSDKRHFTAKVVGADPQSDVAVLKIDATNLPVLTLGNSKGLEVGDYVLAIGDPMGIGETVTLGIVSATGRTNVGVEGTGGYENFIQTDAAINPGNSGGALINSRGELVGINTAIASSSGGNQGIGFAIPIDMARGVMTQLIEHGKVTRGYLGIGIEQMTPALAKQFGLANSEGTLVTEVTDGSPAAKAGLQRGDVILAINGEAISDYSQFRLHIADAAPNSTVHLKIMRNSKVMEVPVTLAQLKDDNQVASNGDDSKGADGGMTGVQIENLTPQIAQQLGVSAQTQGVVVSQVSPDSAAAEAGLARGDVVVEVNRHAVHNAREFQQAMSQANGGSTLLLVNRGKNVLYMAVEGK
jgi:serine protease Do